MYAMITAASNSLRKNAIKNLKKNPKDASSVRKKKMKKAKKSLIKNTHQELNTKNDNNVLLERLVHPLTLCLRLNASPWKLQTRNGVVIHTKRHGGRYTPTSHIPVSDWIVWQNHGNWLFSHWLVHLTILFRNDNFRLDLALD